MDFNEHNATKAVLESFNNIELQDSETICQIPLPISYFKYIFGTI